MSGFKRMAAGNKHNNLKVQQFKIPYGNISNQSITAHS